MNTEGFGRTPEAGEVEVPAAPRYATTGYVLDAIAFLVFIAAVIICLAYIHHFAVNMIFDDQWADINIIQHAHNGTLSLGTLWAQHNENRILFPNLVVLLLADTTHLNTVVEEYLSGVLWIATTGLLVVAHKRRSPATRWIFYCPVVILMLSFTPLVDTLFAFNLSWFMVLFGLAGALFLLDRPGSSWLALAGAVTFAVVGSYSSLQGLLIWPAGLLLLYLRRRALAPLLTWIAAGLVTGIIYFVGFDFKQAGGSGSDNLAHPLRAARFFFSAIGNVSGAHVSDISGGGGNGGLVVGIVIVAIAVWALIIGCRRGQEGGAPIGCALICFGLLFMVSVTAGRLQLGLVDALRYSIFILTIWVGAYLALLDRIGPWTKRSWSERLARVDVWLGVRGASGSRLGSGTPSRSSVAAKVTRGSLLALVALIVLALVIGTHPALDDAAAFRAEGLAADNVTANINDASDAVIASTLGSYPVPYMRQLAGFAARDRLSLFDTPLAAEDRKRGLAASEIVTVVRPKYGDRLSGLQLVIAQISTKGVTTVQFRISGPRLHGDVVIKAKRTYVGWFGAWNTATLRSGSYTLRAVATRADGTQLSSGATAVTVANPVARPKSGRNG
jgi:hypothetical protein